MVGNTRWCRGLEEEGPAVKVMSGNGVQGRT